MSHDLYAALVLACQEVGIVPPTTLPHADGRWHPADLADDRKGKGDGRILLFPDGQGGQVHNWKGESRSFFTSRPNAYSPAEREELDRQRKEVRRISEVMIKERQRRARIRAQKIWASGRPASADHPYLREKQIEPHGLKVGTWTRWRKNKTGEWTRDIVIENALLVPMVDEQGALWNVQAIFPERHPDLGRDKDFIGGARKSGLYFPMECQPMTRMILIAEGFATGATICEGTGKSTIVAFDAGNLEPVVMIIRRKYPHHHIVVCADNDRYTPGNPGLTKARAAAKGVGAKVLVPRFADDQSGSDFNDLLRERR